MMYESILTAQINNASDAGNVIWPPEATLGRPDRGGAHILRIDAASLSAASQSPSLAGRNRGDEPAREMKLLVDETQAREIESRLSPQLSLDPHADPAQGNSYHLSTLYCDTPGLDVLHRRGRYRLFKFRLRRYGDSDKIFLERKSKRGTQVRKRRALVDMADLSYFGQSSPPDTWAGAWYHRQVARNRFAPTCLIEYERVAYFGVSRTGPIRLTFDRNIRGTLRSDWSFDAPASSVRLMPGMVVCELKFRAALPAMFKSVLESMRLVPRGASKYRGCLNACGVAENGTREYA
jgi:hypothetical protein